MIAINQDTLGRQAVSVVADGNQRVLAKRLSKRRRRGGAVQPVRLHPDDLHDGGRDRQERTVVHPGGRVERGDWTQSGSTLVSLGKCLDAPVNPAAGAKAQIWNCTASADQRWSRS